MGVWARVDAWKVRFFSTTRVYWSSVAITSEDLSYVLHYNREAHDANIEQGRGGFQVEGTWWLGACCVVIRIGT